MKILVLGGTGFLGGHIIERFRNEGHEIFAPPSSMCDLRSLEATQSTLREIGPDLVIHAAAMCGGIEFNSSRQAEMLYQNTIINLNAIEAARLANIPRFVNISSSCAYPDLGVPLKEGDLWSGLPHSSVQGYGMSKRLQQHQSMLYRLQYGMDVATVILPNLYGIGDRFDESRSHVVPALIRRFVNAKWQGSPEVRVWGTGTAVRELLFVKDAAEGIRLASEKYNCRCEKPLNVGTGIGHTISEIAHEIKDAVGYEGQIIFDANKPDGQRHKVMDVSRMQSLLGWTPPTTLKQGIGETVRWYMEQERA